MNSNLHESLSALMDNEADELELRRILKELAPEQAEEAAREFSSELKAKWHRYHIISASLRQEIHSVPSRDLLGRIQAQLENEPIPAADTGAAPFTARSGSPRRNSVLQYLGQGAIAASVALAVLFTADMVLVADDSGADNPGMQIAGNEPTDPTPVMLTGELNPATETRVAVQPGLDAEEMDRLRQVVSDELEDSLQNKVIPATFVPEDQR